MTTTPRSMKGYELYSWRVNGAWHFALLEGTNRLKTFEEVTAPEVTIDSVDDLRSRLAQLAPGEEIIWTTWNDERFSLPPEPLLEQVKQACQDLGLNLTIAAE